MARTGLLGKVYNLTVNCQPSEFKFDMKLIAAWSLYTCSSGYLWTVVQLDQRHFDESEILPVQIELARKTAAFISLGLANKLYCRQWPVKHLTIEAE